MLCFSFKEKEINLSETRADAIDNVSADPLEKLLRLFRDDVDMDVY